MTLHYFERDDIHTYLTQLNSFFKIMQLPEIPQHLSDVSVPFPGSTNKLVE